MVINTPPSFEESKESKTKTLQSTTVSKRRQRDLHEAGDEGESMQE